MTKPADLKDDAARRAHFLENAERLRGEMETLSLEVRDLVLVQPPIKLLGHVLNLFQMANMTTFDEARGPDREVIKSFQFALEYLHAIWSSHTPPAEDSVVLDEEAATALMETLERLSSTAMMYCMASSAAAPDDDDGRSAETEFHAKSAWMLIRGHRYQVLEGEFFNYVLEPHAEALDQAYGMQPKAIADGLQNISDAFRSGFGDAVETLGDGMDRAFAEVEASGDDLGTVLERLNASDPAYASNLAESVKDMFFGGVCNLSRHSSLSASLLEDMSFEPGQDERFFAAGDFAGTPMRTLPARSRPGIKLGDAFYATDGQFVRDSAYRAIQWGLWKRLPYRDEWLKRQARVVEQAFPKIFAAQLDHAQTYESVYYRDPQTDEWTETDLVIVLEDVLIIVEAKAGAMPMHSPATNFASHERVINGLVVEAYRQCRRFLDYLASGPEVPLFHLVDGEHVEIGRLRRAQFRRLFPIGLTVEAFTPFSALAKELPEITPILGAYPFMSMSVDDLFVLTRFLPTTGELVHYLEVRQAVAGLRKALLFDETDHLGAYVMKNRFDQDIVEQLKTSDRVTWSHFSDVVDRHFEGPDWRAKPIPSQPYPDAMRDLLEALDRHRPAGWLMMDACLRDMGSEMREDFARIISDLIPTLEQHPRRRFQLGGDDPIQVWVCRPGAFPSDVEFRRHAETGCLIDGAKKMAVLIVGFDAKGRISGLSCASVAAPSILRTDYGALKAEADRLRARATSPSRPEKIKGRGRHDRNRRR